MAASFMSTILARGVVLVYARPPREARRPIKLTSLEAGYFLLARVAAVRGCAVKSENNPAWVP